jgi:hypothetical protein
MLKKIADSIYWTFDKMAFLFRMAPVAVASHRPSGTFLKRDAILSKYKGA